MSDCGIYGNKNWQRAVDKASDKPAATVHGTGSGEATCQCWNYMSDGCDLHGNRPLPTPPASPTVTLQRWSFVTDRREGCPVAFTNPNGQWVKYEDALALLRAAKRQQ